VVPVLVVLVVPVLVVPVLAVLALLVPVVALDLVLWIQMMKGIEGIFCLFPRELM
jgi:hypothetical protein